MSLNCFIPQVDLSWILSKWQCSLTGFSGVFYQTREGAVIIASQGFIFILGQSQNRSISFPTNNVLFEGKFTFNVFFLKIYTCCLKNQLCSLAFGFFQKIQWLGQERGVYTLQKNILGVQFWCKNHTIEPTFACVSPLQRKADRFLFSI